MTSKQDKYSLRLLAFFPSMTHFSLNWQNGFTFILFPIVSVPTGSSSLPPHKPGNLALNQDYFGTWFVSYLTCVKQYDKDHTAHSRYAIGQVTIL